MSGKLKQGEYLPSIRALARELKISVITTMKAYEQLESEGLVTAMQGKGFYVNSQDSDMMKEQYMRKVEESLQDAIDAAKVAGHQQRGADGDIFCSASDERLRAGQREGEESWKSRTVPLR